MVIALPTSMPRALPTSMPRALVEGHTQQEADIGETCEFERGEARRAPIYRSVPNVVSVRWRLTQAQFDDFDDWFENTLLAGSLAFDLPVADQGSDAAVLVAVMFTAPPECGALPGGRWLVQAQCVTGDAVDPVGLP